MQQTLSVKQLNLYVKSLLESDINLLSCSVCGEITNFKRHISSGHIYFTLSDGEAAIKCVMFKGNALRNKFDLSDGMSVVCNGRVSLYEKDGGYQFYVENAVPAGLGDQLIALKLLTQKLAKEGLFDQENKRPISKFPKRIAVVTSSTGAALQDIINVISRRYPVCEIVVCGAGVQGDLAVRQMIATLEKIYEISEKIDTIIIGRGGGSSEDLSAFNDEALVRKIYESPIPVISAVGHQTDTTLCDMVADLRAPTPSAAAELAVPDISAINILIDNFLDSANRALTEKYLLANARLSTVLNSNILKKPYRIIEDRRLVYSSIYDKISSRINIIFEKKQADFLKTASKIETLSPMKVMLRGYSVATINGKTVTSISNMNINDEFSLKVADGKYICNVKDKE
ncbi:MAG: exodeoxyribonuclease VII large subunit [Ruminococcaceae bacterium]|nr:exodeoxyribonuclease VII large subunit [Oscillospiraceae bacterium]